MDQLSRSLQISAFFPAKMLSEDARPDGCCLDSVQSRAPIYVTASALDKELGALRIGTLRIKVTHDCLHTLIR